MSQPTYGEALAYAHVAAQKLLHRYVDDLKPEEFRHQPAPGANNAYWILGHLVRSARMACEKLAIGPLPALPAGWLDRFNPTRAAAPAEQEAGDANEALRFFDEHQALLIAGLPSVEAPKFAEPPPWPVPLFTNLGEFVHFLSLHVAIHAGQISLIRRSLGKPPVS